MGSTLRILLLLLSAHFQFNAAQYAKLTNAVCESYNKSWVTLELCRLQAVQRNKIVLNINATFLHPAKDIFLRLQVLKKESGYKPWLADYTFDACNFMRRRNQPVAKIFWNLFKDYSTVNHTCPYVGKQMVRGFYPNVENVPLPLPSGEYALFLTWIFDKKPQFITNVYFMFVENTNLPQHGRERNQSKAM